MSLSRPRTMPKTSGKPYDITDFMKGLCNRLFLFSTEFSTALWKERLKLNVKL